MIIMGITILLWFGLTLLTSIYMLRDDRYADLGWWAIWFLSFVGLIVTVVLSILETPA